MVVQRQALAIELTYRDGEPRVLMAHWRLAERGWPNGRAMFNVEGACGCLVDFERLIPCGKHVDAWMYRVIDIARPRGVKKLVRS
jgi:hypothetical protein